MPTEVIHIRETPPGWSKDPAAFPDYVYVGRPGKGLRSQWGNPFSTGRDGTLEEVLEAYLENLVRWMQDPEFVRELGKIKDKKLVCFCKPKEGFQGRLLCHAQLLAAAADGKLEEDYPRKRPPENPS